VFGHGWVLLKGQKLSKSLGNIVDPLDAADRFGPDPLRLYLVKEIVFGSDGDFTWERFEEKYNVDLANNLGNLVNRVTAMAERYRNGRLEGTQPNEAMIEVAAGCVREYREAMDRFALDVACRHAFRLVDAVNEYIAASEPWTLAKRDDGQRALDEVLWTSTEALRAAALLLSPVMPGSSEEILRRVGAPGTTPLLDRDSALAKSGRRTLTRKDAMWPRLEAAGDAESETIAVSTKETRVTDQPKPDAAAQPVPSPTPPPAPAAAATDDRISIDEFMKIDLRVARVTAAERVPNSKKLVKLNVDVGTEQRTLVAGIAEAYEAESLVGRHVAIVANLKPAKLMGIESNGMILAASPEGGKPILVAFDLPPTPGTRVR
jgi:methionyl-tRNA synthetase